MGNPDLLHLPGLFWSVNGTESPIGSWSCRTVLHGTARRSIACPRSVLPSPGPNGTAPASLACGTGGPRSMPGSPNEVSTSNWQGPLCDLYEGLDRPGSLSGFQLAGCPVRGSLGLYQKPGACRLDFDPLQV